MSVVRQAQQPCAARSRSTAPTACRSAACRRSKQQGSSRAAGIPIGGQPERPPASGFVQPRGMMNNILELNEHRRGVGLCVYRRDGLVFTARRVDDPQRSWQMPQGGIDPLENPMRAAYRELQEETGITPAHCRIVASIDRWLEYSFPTKVADPRSGDFLRYRGQTQKWFLFEYTGDDSDIDLSCHGHPEFSEFSWRRLEALPEGVVDFKRGVYGQVASYFGPEIARRVATLSAV